MTYEANEFWSRVMAKPVEVTPDPDEPEYAVPESARTQDQWGAHVPTVESLRSHAGIPQEPVTAPVAPSDGRMTNGTPATPRQNVSPFRVFDTGPWDD
jgi:hypothetical protein